MTIDFNVFLHNWWEDYGIVKTWVVRVLGDLKVESIGKMDFCDNKQTNKLEYCVVNGCLQNA